MKISVKREPFLRWVAPAANACSVRDPKLQNVLIEAKEGGCVASGTDLEIGVRAKFDAVVDKDGSALVCGKKLLEVLRAIGDEDVDIADDGITCRVSGQSDAFELSSGDASAFPGVPTGPDAAGQSPCVVSAMTLASMIARTAFAQASGEQLRYAATQGTRIQHDTTRLRLVTTDGRRLATAFTTGIAGEFEGTIPSKAVALLLRELGEGDVGISVQNEAFFRTDTLTLYTRLVEGKFPKWQNAIPKPTGKSATITSGIIAEAARAAAIVNDKESAGMQFAFSSGRLSISAKSSSHGSGVIVRPILYDGPAVTVRLDGRFVMQMLLSLDKDAEVLVDIKDASSPVLFRCGEDWTGVIVPLVQQA